MTSSQQSSLCQPCEPQKLTVCAVSLALLLPIPCAAAAVLPGMVSPGPANRIVAGPPSTAREQLEERRLALEVEKLELGNANSKRDLGRPPATARKQLEEKRLALEVEKLQLGNANSKRDLGSFRGWVNLLYSNLAALVAIAAGLLGLLRYLRDRRDEFRRREDERFETIVANIGSGQDSQRVSAAVLLPTFLRPGYERFFVQVFNLVAGSLRPITSLAQAKPPRGQRDSLPASVPDDSALQQALLNVLRESYPSARKVVFKLHWDGKEEADKTLLTGRYLNAASIQLNHAYLSGADLEHGWLRNASLRGASLAGANLSKANLEGIVFAEADLDAADLTSATLTGADFSLATLKFANLSKVHANDTHFDRADMESLTMDAGTVIGASFFEADLTKARFVNVVFGELDRPKERQSNIEAAKSLKDTVFEDAKGLTPAQIARCSEKGAIFKTTGA